MEMYDLPHEKAVLASIILENSCLDTKLLEPHDFHAGVNQIIYKQMLEMFSKGAPIDLVTLTTALCDGGYISPAYLASLTDETPTATHYEHYCNLVKDKSVLRQFYNMAERLKVMVEHGDTFEVKDYAEREIERISTDSSEEGFSKVERSIDDHLKKYLDTTRKPGISTGFKDIDRLSGGLHPGETYVLAARPKMGKTTLALNILTNIVKAGTAVGFLSLEMSRDALLTRIICAEASVDSSKVKTGELSEVECKVYREAGQMVSKWPLYINTAHPSLAVLKSQARALVRKFGVQVLAIDYLQLLRSGVKEDRYSENTNNSRDLHNLAQELGVPIVILSQLSRASEKEGRRPRLSDLRETGAIEQDADIVAMLYQAPDEDYVEFEVKANRSGPTGMVKLDFERAYNRFSQSDKGGW